MVLTPDKHVFQGLILNLGDNFFFCDNEISEYTWWKIRLRNCRVIIPCQSLLSRFMCRINGIITTRNKIILIGFWIKILCWFPCKGISESFLAYLVKYNSILNYRNIWNIARIISWFDCVEKAMYSAFSFNSCSRM